MSVINQSLKALETRQAQQGKAGQTPYTTEVKQSAPVPYIIMFGVFCLIAAGAYLSPVNISFTSALPVDVAEQNDNNNHIHDDTAAPATSNSALTTLPTPSITTPDTEVAQVQTATTPTAKPEPIENAPEGKMQIVAAQGKSRQAAATKDGIRIALDRGNDQEAIRLLEIFIAERPQETQERLLLARIYYRNKNIDRALAVLSSPDVVYTNELLALRATFHNETQNYRLAVKDYQRLSIIEPNNTKWMLGAAVAHDRLNQHQDAFNAYLQIKERGNLPTNIESFVGQRLSVLRELI